MWRVYVIFSPSSHPAYAKQGVSRRKACLKDVRKKFEYKLLGNCIDP